MRSRRGIVKRARRELLHRRRQEMRVESIGLPPSGRRAVFYAGGRLPASYGYDLCRLTRWGKNHHLLEDGERTVCGIEAPRDRQRPVRLSKGWCVQCSTIVAEIDRRTEEEETVWGS